MLLLMGGRDTQKKAGANLCLCLDKLVTSKSDNKPNLLKCLQWNIWHGGVHFVDDVWTRYAYRPEGAFAVILGHCQYSRIDFIYFTIEARGSRRWLPCAFVLIRR